MFSNHPRIIQGGMGAGVSNWRLARAVALTGQLGVVSGTALDQILARRLHDGDPGGHMRRGLDHFPFPEMAKRIRDAYFIPEGKATGASYRTPPLHTKDGPRHVWELCIVANFVEVFLAREGHSGLVGINYLEKVQLPHLSSIYGAMLAGVQYILMGAGIPLKIPGVLDSLARHEPATYPLPVSGAEEGDDTTIRFSPADFMEQALPQLARPAFLAIIASNTLATTMLKKANGRVDGFVIEGPTAGGHNAPPRGKQQLSASGEPVYGERDIVDLDKLSELGKPFWLAGGYGRPGKLSEALAAGAAGIQAGTIFQFCTESGLSEEYKQAILASIASGEARVVTDPLASPTGFPFKVAQVEGSLSDPEVFEGRGRVCDIGYLREAYRTPDGRIGYRCAAEAVTTYVAKGGKLENTVGRKCLCNALLANIGYAQTRKDGYVEKALVTAGDDLAALARYMPSREQGYGAADVVAMLMDEAAGRQRAFQAADSVLAAIENAAFARA